jgi:VCBS repeat-containing protein
VRNPQQTFRVTGPAGAKVELLDIEAGLYTPTCAGCTIGEYEVNSATAVKLFTGTLDANGRLDFPVTLTRTDSSSGIHYLAAVISLGDDATGPLSNKIIVEYDPDAEVNTPPDVVDDAYTMDEDTTLNGDVTDNDSDLDADPLTISLVGGPAHGLLTLNPDGTFSYAPNLNFFGQDTFTYRASDGYGGQAEGEVTITVNPVNDSPEAADDSYVTFAGVALTVADNQGVLKNDSDPDDAPDALSAALATMPTNGSVVVAPKGGFTYQPNPGFTGADSFTYTASDDEGASDTATVTITVEPVPGSGERLVNNSFEQHTEGKPDGWVKQRLKNDRIRCNLVGRPGKPDRIFALEGECAFQFVGSATENSLLRQRADIADLNAGDTVQFIAHARGTNVVSNAARIRLVAVYTDAPTKQMTINLPAGTYDYRRFTRTLQLAGQLKVLRVDIQYLPRGTKGNFLVDMLSLREIAAP